MKKPPCKINGIDCPRRYVGCRAECEEYHRWEAAHRQEKDMIFKAKGHDIAVDTFLAEHRLRDHMAKNRDYDREKRRR